MQGGVLRRGDQLAHRGHEGGDRRVVGGVVDAVIAGSDDAQQLAGGGAVVGDGDGGVAGAGLELQHVVEGGVGAEVGVGHHIAGLIGLDPADHGGLVLDALGAVDEGDAALTGQRNGQVLARDRLHDGADHRDVHLKGALLLPFAVLDQGGLEADCSGHVLRGGVAGDQQIFAEGTGGFFIKICHDNLLFSCQPCETPRRRALRRAGRRYKILGYNNTTFGARIQNLRATNFSKIRSQKTVTLHSPRMKSLQLIFAACLHRPRRPSQSVPPGGMYVRRDTSREICRGECARPQAECAVPRQILSERGY